MSVLGPPSALTAVRDLRPQAYGTARTDKVRDPIIEPLWAGVRVLAAVDLGTDGAPTASLSEDGEPLHDHPDLAATIATVARAESLILDGYLVRPDTYDESAVILGRDIRPKTGEVVAQQVLGRRRNRRAEIADRIKTEQVARTFRKDEAATFVVVDVLWVDGQPLLDVPLLERKRLLESVIDEADGVRRGAYVRAPINTWVASWRAQGFSGLVFKAANGRYHPGGTKDDWVTIPIPQR